MGNADLDSSTLNAKWRSRRRIIAAVVVVSFVVLNMLAFRYARAFTTYVDGGVRTKSPEDLTFRDKLHTLIHGVVVPRPRTDRTPADAGQPFSLVTVAGEIGGLECWHLKHEDPIGRVYLLPGYTESKSTLIDEALFFRALGFETVLVDFRGCAGSDGERNSIGYFEAEDVRDVVEHFESSMPLERRILFGRSLGAVAALRAVADLSVDVERLILEEPFGALLETIENRFEILGVPSFGLAHLLVFWGGAQLGFDGFAHRSTNYAMRVAAPTLVLRGALDDRVSSASTAALVAALPEGHLFEFEGVAHEPILPAAPKVWRSRVEQFVSGP